MNKSQRSKSPEALRLKFWEVAPPFYANGITPFAEMRLSRGLRIGEVAARMDWESADYAELEYGDMNASPATILNFCRAMKCHPLDLYCPEAGPETPLPREILYSLVEMVEKPGFSDTERVRSLQRLDIEYRRARAMVLENRNYLRPLLMAIGYSPDFKSYRAPLYDASHDEEDIGVRRVMELSLLESQMLLEETRDNHLAIQGGARQNLEGNRKLMMEKAGELFGHDKAETAITGLAGLMKLWENRQVQFRMFRKAPGIVGTPVRTDDNADPSQVMNDKRIFFISVRRHLQLGALLENIDADVQQADEQVQKFVRWRESTRTRTLLDWYEDCEVLNNFTECPVPAKNLKPGVQPMPG